MTAAVILQLVQEGKLRLEDPVAKYRPEVPNGQNITIAQMLEMRSGLFSYTFDETFEARLDAEPEYMWRPGELLGIAFAHPPSFTPGAGYEYSNTNTVLLGLRIEQLTGKSLEDQFRQRIFQPLGLKQTTMPVDKDNRIPTPHPHGYMFGTNLSTLTEPGAPASERTAAENGTLRPDDFTGISPSWAWAAGSAISTANDLARYIEALADGELLNADQQREIGRAHV
jgi:D-alanyl-D-alanine carboxypeptidase